MKFESPEAYFLYLEETLKTVLAEFEGRMLGECIISLRRKLKQVLQDSAPEDFKLSDEEIETVIDESIAVAFDEQRKLN